MPDIVSLTSNRSLAIYAIIAAIVIAALAVTGIQWSGRQLTYTGYVGNMTVARALALSAISANSPYVSVIPQSNRIVFSSTNANVVVLNIDVSEAVAIANLNKTRYRNQGDVLVIDGLVYPTIILPDNSTLNVTFVNLDDDENCGIFISYRDPALEFGSTPAGLYTSSTFKTPLLGQFNAPQGIAQAAFSPTTNLTDFDTLWYLNSCSDNVTYGTIYNAALS